MWLVEYLPKATEEEAELPPDMQARLGHMTDVIRDYGLLALPPGWVKPLGNKLWELRITGKDERTASGDRADFHQENAEDATT